ncbi:hypothetical protein WG66_002036 [Moniliophthora roreri]|nr:hypothetical protein WG66_002036 [Moniliophthora roreri]
MVNFEVVAIGLQRTAPSTFRETASHSQGYDGVSGTLTA